jgi:hypothetical protein
VRVVELGHAYVPGATSTHSHRTTSTMREGEWGLAETDDCNASAEAETVKQGSR